MNDLLLDVPEVTPRWRELAEELGIYSHFSGTVEDTNEAWSAWSFHCLEGDYEPDWKDREPLDLISEYCALIDSRRGVQLAPTEREAVVGLIHRLKLPGWETVSLN